MNGDDATPGDDELFRIAVDLSPAGLLAVDASGTIVLVNREVERLFGYTRGELIGRSVDMIVPERFHDDPPRPGDDDAAEPRERPAGRGRDVHGRRKDGSEIPLEIELKPVPTSRGRLVLASVVDVSARKRAEERFQAAVESAPSGMIMVDATGAIVLVNREAERLFGWKRDELVGLSIEVLVPERFRHSHPAQRTSFAGAPSARPMGAGRELFGLRKDGSEIPIEIGLNPLRTEDGVFVLSSVVDVTARREAEARLRESEERFRLLVDGVQDYAILMLAPDGTIASWNLGAQRILGWTADEMLGRHYSVFHPGAFDAGLLARADVEGRVQEEGSAKRRDGSHVLVETLVTALPDRRGALRGFALLLRDVTAQRALEERLRQSQKLEAIGTLAGGIAHDFNNVLAGIVGYAELSILALQDRADLQADIGKILRAAERGRDLVKRILTFSRGGERELGEMRMQALVSEIVALLRSSLPASIEIREHCDPRTPAVRGDATQLQQVILNLATNAAAAMSETGGVFEVSLAPCQVDEQLVGALPGIAPGLHARLTVADSGVGMSHELQARIFEPFFTTKPRGSGTGLGLSIVHGIVRSHGGGIALQSTPGRGTTFRVYLPAAAQDHDHEEISDMSDAEKTIAPHVLYCEDEQLLAELAERQLEGLGYRVTMHSSSLEALEDFRARPRDFDAVVTDNTMPHMTGLVLAQEMLRIRPDVPIIMVSGLGLSLNHDVIRAKGIRHVLAKPHRRDELAQLLAEVTRPPEGA